MDDYACVSKSKLKLKNDTGVKKKKKKSKDKDKEREALQKSLSVDKSQSNPIKERSLTKAEMAFKQQQEKMVI